MDNFEKKISDFKQPVKPLENSDVVEDAEIEQEESDVQEIDADIQDIENNNSVETAPQINEPVVPTEPTVLPIKPQKSKRKFVLILAAVVVVLIGGGAAAYFVWLKPSGSDMATTTGTAKTTPSPSPSTAAATDDSSLESDLTGVQSSMSQADSDQANATNAVNDNSQQVAVPTQ